MWLFLSSEFLFFGALISNYLLYSHATSPQPYPAQIYDIPFTSVSSFVLLMSSLTMVLAHNASRGDQTGPGPGFSPPPRSVRCSSPARFSSSPSSSRSRHEAAHQSGRVGLLPAHRVPRDPRRHRGDHASVPVGDSRAPGWAERQAVLNLELVGLYWHFVDIIWIVIFTVVYLLTAVPGGG